MTNSNSSTVTASASLRLQKDELEVLSMGLEVLQQQMALKVPSLAEDHQWILGLGVLFEKIDEAAADIENQS